MTVYFVNVSLMLGFLREANTSKSVIDIYDELYQRLGGQDFRRLFPVILTDNGSEFSNPKCIEKGPDGKGFQRTRIYYCNPSAPYQKAEIEVGHEFIRRVVPKGKSFDELAQADIDLIWPFKNKKSAIHVVRLTIHEVGVRNRPYFSDKLVEDWRWQKR